MQLDICVYSRGVMFCYHSIIMFGCSHILSHFSCFCPRGIMREDIHAVIVVYSRKVADKYIGRDMRLVRNNTTIVKSVVMLLLSFSVFQKHKQVSNL
jgi:hypothetical protein